jgi:hypothetical protein
VRSSVSRLLTLILKAIATACYTIKKNRKEHYHGINKNSH